jgi:hypothetical protein
LAVVAPATSADVTNPRRRLWAAMFPISLFDAPACRNSRLMTSATTRPSMLLSRDSLRENERAELRSLLLLKDSEPCVERRHGARPVSSPSRARIPRAALIRFALTDRQDHKAAPAEIEVIDVQAAISARRRQANVSYTIVRSPIAMASRAAVAEPMPLPTVWR